MTDHENTLTTPESILPTPPETHPLAAVRDLVLQAHPHLVPELVSGDTLEDLLESIEPARAAFQRLAERLPTTPLTVPAGASSPASLDPERIPASRKIQLGLRDRNSHLR